MLTAAAGTGLQVVVELVNRCNLRCAYCLRGEAAFPGEPLSALEPDLLRRVLREARGTVGSTSVSLTGGEPTLHPRFEEVVGIVAGEGHRLALVTNGWGFDRVAPALRAHLPAVGRVAFSLDGTTAEDHDRWRGPGSYRQVMRAIAACEVSELPFGLKVAIREDTVDRLEAFVSLGARLGARAVRFHHVLPTPEAAGARLPAGRWREAEEEVAALARVFRVRVGMGPDRHNDAPGPPCRPLAGLELNVDHRGRLTLCCNLSGFRGAEDGEDVVADLRVTPLGEALERFRALARSQVERRRAWLLGRAGRPGPHSPCTLCLETFGKLPRAAVPVRAAGPAPENEEDHA